MQVSVGKKFNWFSVDVYCGRIKCHAQLSRKWSLSVFVCLFLRVVLNIEEKKCSVNKGCAL